MNPHKEREKFTQTIGVVFGQRSQLWWDIAVQESFRLLKKVYKVSDEQYNDHMEHVIKTLDIGPLLDKPVRKLSLGQRMRCELAAALIHNPPLLFLDEPTIGTLGLLEWQSALMLQNGMLYLFRRSRKARVEGVSL